MLTITVAICTKDRHVQLLETLDSLLEQTRQPDELVIIDASRDDAGPSIEPRLARFPKATYLRAEPGLTRQRNIAIEAAAGDLVFFFDDDVVLDERYLEIMTAVFDDDQSQRLGGAMGQIMSRGFGAKKLYQFAASIFLLNDTHGSGQLKRSGFPSFAHGQMTPFKVEALSGCCMVYRRKALEKHRFDESLGGYAYMEDVDFSYRVSRDWSLLYEPQAVLQHLAAPTARESLRQRSRMLVVNHHYLFKKNLPQTPLNTLAHWWSILGLAIVGLTIQRSSARFYGVIDGLRSVGRPRG